MGSRSRNKGKVGERELARFLTAEGFDATRGVQYQGGPGSPDVRCPDLPIHWEAKRTERLRIYEAIQQAVDEAPDGKMPVVAHRRNRGEWVAILRLEDLLAILRESDLVGGQ